MIVLRTARPGDQGYVASTWVHSASGTGGRPIGRQRAAREFANDVDRLLNRSDTRIVIAADAAQLDIIAGWLAHVHRAPVPCVHYVYVRKNFRRQGVATRLLEHAGLARDRAATWTCAGPDLASLARCYPAAVPFPLKEFLS